jgi:hypothetical protein
MKSIWMRSTKCHRLRGTGNSSLRNAMFTGNEAFANRNQLTAPIRAAAQQSVRRQWFSVVGHSRNRAGWTISIDLAAAAQQRDTATYRAFATIIGQAGTAEINLLLPSIYPYYIVVLIYPCGTPRSRTETDSLADVVMATRVAEFPVPKNVRHIKRNGEHGIADRHIRPASPRSALIGLSSRRRSPQLHRSAP